MVSASDRQVGNLQRTLEKGNNEIQISVDHIRNGLYVLIINKGHERIVKKVMIDR
jgi:hypothetical protein